MYVCMRRVDFNPQEYMNLLVCFQNPAKKVSSGPSSKSMNLWTLSAYFPPVESSHSSHAKWNDGLHGADVDRYKAEIILINFALGNNF